ncbi:MAG: RbsD/FucU domain-containing protein [Clostridia bacterium]
MLKGMSKLLSPELIKILSEMGHSDEIVIVDANFPSANFAKRLIRYPGISSTDILSAVLEVFPLDSYVKSPAALMNATDMVPEVWEEYKEIINKAESSKIDIEMMERFDFYERAKKAYAIIASGEERLYGNIILKKGVIK